MPKVPVIDGTMNLAENEWAIAEAGDHLETGGASTCAIVAALNQSQGLAWMVHQVAPYMITDDLSEMLADAAANADPADNVVIYALGCESGTTSQADRSAVLHEIRVAFPSIAPITHWGIEELHVEHDGTNWIIS